MPQFIHSSAVSRWGGMRSALWLFVLRVVAGLVLAATGFIDGLTPAHAGAFNEPAGSGLVILEGLYDTGAHSFDRSGRIIATDRFQKREGWIYLQYGVTDWFQVIAKPDIVSTSLAGRPGARYTGPGTNEIGGQIQLPGYGPFVFALQGTFRLPLAGQPHNLALIGNTSRDTDGRGLVGSSFMLGGFPAFVDAEAGYRIRGQGAPDEVHVDLTGGIRFWPRLLLLAQSFTTVPTQPGTPFGPRSTYSNLEGSGVYDISEHWALQLGVFGTVVGRNALRERGVQTGIWYKF